MRWLSYFILAYVVLGLQSGLSGYVNYHGAMPNLALIAAVFIALHAPRESALLGCFIMGAMQDLLAQHPLGLYAFGYGLVAMVVSAAQGFAYREHPLTHFVMTLLGSLVLGSLVLLHGLMHPPRLPVTPLLIGGLYSALIAPVMVGLLQKLKGVFAFQPTRRKARPWM